MKSVRVFSIPELESLLSNSTGLQFTVIDKTEAYTWIAATLKGYGYRKLSRHERGLVIAYIQKLTGYKQRQTNRLIARWL